MEDEARTRRLTRRWVLQLCAGSCLAAYVPAARADLFGGDIGVLIAQFQQQVQMVSQMIQTVQGVYATVERVQKVVQQGDIMLMATKGQGGLKGVLNAAQTLTGTAQGVLSNLQRINVRGGQWKNIITAQHGSLNAAQATKLTAEVMDMNTAFLRDVGNVYDTYRALDGVFEAVDSSAAAVSEASGTPGMIGQMQLLGREFYQLSSIAARQTAIHTQHALLYTDDLRRQAMQRELAEWQRRRLYGNYGRPQESLEPTDVDLVLGPEDYKTVWSTPR